MGLLASSVDDPMFGANMALAAGLLQGNFGGGLLGFQQSLAQSKQDAIKRELLQAQIDETRAQADERKNKTAMERAALEASQRKQTALPGLFSQPMSSGAFTPPVGGGPTMPQSAAPQAATFDVQGALRAGFTPKEIQEFAALRNINLEKVARTVKGLGPDNKEYEYQVDEFGRKVGEGLPQWKAPHYQDLGGQVGVFDGYGNRTGGLDKSQTPDGKASNAVAWANNAATLRGQNLVDARARETSANTPRGQIVETQNGFMLADPRAGTASPVTGPDGQQIRGKAADRQMTDSQAKANLFGSRMSESDRILKSLEGKYSPMAVNAKMAAAEMPVVGGLAGATGNMMLSTEGQQAEQAQRDFVNAVLRRESGAVISPSEFANAQKQYLPQPNDDAKTLSQKRRNRQIAIEGLFAEVPADRRGVPSLTGLGQSGGATGGWSIQKVN